MIRIENRFLANERNEAFMAEENRERKKVVDLGSKKEKSNGYYEELYNDLPKEVVEILMKTHPFIAKEGEEEAPSDSTRRIAHEDTEKVRRVRRATAREEEPIPHIAPAEPVRLHAVDPPAEEENFVYREPVLHKEEIPGSQAPVQDTGAVGAIEDDDEVESDLIQLVKHKPRSHNRQAELTKKSPQPAEASERVQEEQPVRAIQEESVSPVRSKKSGDGQEEPMEKRRVREVEGTEKRRPAAAREEGAERGERAERRRPSAEARSKEAERRPAPQRAEGERVERRRPRRDYANEDLDFEKLEKEKTLDAFFQNSAGFDDEDDVIHATPKMRKIAIGAVVAAIVLFGFLSFKVVSLSGKLNTATEQIDTLTTVQLENEQLKLDKLALEEELKTLTAATMPVENEGGESQGDGQTPGGDAITPAGEGATASDGTYDTYTVQAGDTIGTISTKIYGTYGEYKRILEANGLTEGTAGSIQIGQVLKIPKLN